MCANSPVQNEDEGVTAMEVALHTRLHVHLMEDIHVGFGVVLAVVVTGRSRSHMDRCAVLIRLKCADS